MKLLVTIGIIFTCCFTELSAQPRLQWSLRSSSAIMTSPLLLDVYMSPHYADGVGEPYYGQEIYLAGFEVVPPFGVSVSLFMFHPNAEWLFPDGHLQFSSIIRSAPTGSFFSDHAPAKVIFGTTDGCALLSTSGNSFNIPIAGGVTATPVLANMDTDVWPEAVLISNENQLYVWDLEEAQPRNLTGFPKLLDDAANHTPPTVANIDANSPAEIIATTLHAVHVLNRAGNYLSGWPAQFSATISTAPIIGKLDTFDQTSRNIIFATDDGYLYRTRPNGGYLPGTPTNLGSPVDTSPILADLDQNGKPEIIICTSDGRAHVLNANGGYFPGWPVQIPDSLRHGNRESRVNSVFMEPLAADIDGDGVIEVLLFLTEHAALVALEPNGRIKPGYPVLLGRDRSSSGEPQYSNLQAVPAISDIDYDGKLELVMGTAGIFTDSRIKVYELGPDPANPALKPWPMYRQNARHTGVPQEGFAPTCAFPSQRTFAPGGTFEIDFLDYVKDIDTPSVIWKCVISGAQNLRVEQLTATRFRITGPRTWFGGEALALQVSSDGQTCSGSLQVISGYRGDTDANGQIDTDDFDEVAEAIVRRVPSTFYQKWAADYNENGVVNVSDLLALIQMVLIRAK